MINTINNVTTVRLAVLRATLPVLFLLALTACGSSTELPRPMPPEGKIALIVEQKGQQTLPLPGSVFWDGSATPATVAYTGKAQFKPKLSLEQAHPNGIRLVAYYEHSSADLQFKIPEDCDDGFGGLKSTCYAQLGLVSFDKTGNADVVVAFGDGLINYRVNVIRYHPPGSESDLARTSNWELIASINGQSQAIIADTTIELPYGGQGLSRDFAFVHDKFLDAGDVNHGSGETPAPTTATRTPPPAAPSISSAPVRTYYAVVSGAPLCSSFSGAVTAAAVMRTGNAMAIDSVLSRKGCQTTPQHIELDPGASVQDLQAGVVVINTPGGDRVYTTEGSISTSRH